MASPEVFDPLTRYQCCPPTCGAAAAVARARTTSRRSKGLRHERARSRRRRMTTDTPSTFDGSDMIKMVGYDMAEAAAQEGLRGARASARTRSTSSSCTTASRPTSCSPTRRWASAPEGEAEKFIMDGDNTTAASRHEPVGRPALQGPSARRHRPRAVHRARLAAARPGRPAPGGRRADRAPAQPRPRRRLRRDDVPGGLKANHDRPSLHRPHAAAVSRGRREGPAALLREGHGPDRSRSTAMRQPRVPRATLACRCRPRSCSACEMEALNPAAIRELLGLDYRRRVARRARFHVPRPAYAGDTLTFEQRIERHLRQEGRRAGVRGAQDPRDQPARRAGGRPALRDGDAKRLKA